MHYQELAVEIVREVEMSRMRDVQSKKRGAALALALFVVVILLVTGVGLLGLGLQARVYAARTSDEIAARAAADAGLTRVVFEMNERLKANRVVAESSTGDDVESPSLTDRISGNEILANCDATFSYNVVKAINYLAAKSFSGTVLNADEAQLVEYLNSTTPGQSDYVIECVGRCGHAERIVYALLRLKGLGEYGLLVRDFITLKSRTLVDGFNTSDPTDSDVEVEIGTISTLPDKVVLNNGVVVNGNVLVGVGGDPDVVIKDLGAETGHRYPLPEEPDFPVITPPYLRSKGTISAHGKTIHLSPVDSGKYRKITLKRGVVPAILEISGGDVVLYVTENIDMGQECEIKITKGSTLTLYSNGDILADEGAGFNNEGVPADLEIWGTAKHEQRFELNAKSEYFGQLYAPNATVTIMAKGDLYGAFTSKSFEMKSGGNLFYDGALRDVKPDDEGVRFVVERWYE